MNRQLKFEIRDSSQIGGARRAAQQLSLQIGLDETDAGKVAIAVTELGTNLLKHAKGGEMLLRAVGSSHAAGVEILAVDRGPGMADVAGFMRDGFSTAGSMGAGLGSLSRLASAFDVYSTPGKGTVVRVQIAGGDDAAVDTGSMDVEFGAVCQPVAGEEQCGDDWTVTRQRHRNTLTVADGLGHGPDAHKAALIAVNVANDKTAQEPAALLDDIHAASRAGRGAAVAVCSIEHESAVCRFAGVGNVACAVVVDGRQRFFASHAGIVGHSIRKIQEFSAPWPSSAMLVMHSDGLATQWNLAKYPGLVTRHPAIVASVLYRDFARGRDDVTVVVARNRAKAA